MHGKRRKMGPGSALDVTLARARELARLPRSKVLDGIDPQVDRMATKAPPKHVVTFGQFTTDLLDSIEEGFRNAQRPFSQNRSRMSAPTTFWECYSPFG